MRTKRALIPPIIFAIIFGLVGFFAAPIFRESWTNQLTGEADEFARAIANAHKLDRNSSITDNELAHQYLDRFETPQQISQSITEELLKESKTKNLASQQEKFDDAFDIAWTNASITELKSIVLEIGNARKPSASFFIVFSVFGGILFGLVLPFILRISWQFFIDRIRELSQALQGKGESRDN